MKRTALLSCLFCSLALAQPMQKPMLGDQIDWSNPLSRGLVGYWLMNEGGGSVVRNAAQNANHGAIAAGVNWVPGRFGPCLLFDDSHTVACGTMNSLFGAQALSVSVWLWVTDNADNQGLISASSSPPGRVFDAYVRTIGKINFRVYNSDATAAICAGVRVLGVNEWHHWVGVWDGANVYQYIDGVADGTPVSLTGALYGSGANAVVIGSAPAYGAMDGMLDAPAVWSRALSPSEIASLYRDPYQMFRQGRPEMFVSAGGSPPTPNRVRVIVISGLPFWVILSMVGLLVYDKQERKRAA